MACNVCSDLHGLCPDHRPRGIVTSWPAGPDYLSKRKEEKHNGPRPDIDTYFIRMADLVSTRGTCGRRLVGCVLVNDRNHLLATGYNGVPRGMAHCRGGSGCAGVRALSGQSLDLCNATHAEQNALLQCPDVYAIATAYVTASPCMTCTKLLLNTSCKRIVFSEEYPHASARALWEEAGREWVHYKKD